MQWFFGNHRIHFMDFVTLTDLIYKSNFINDRLWSLKFSCEMTVGKGNPILHV